MDPARTVDGFDGLFRANLEKSRWRACMGPLRSRRVRQSYQFRTSYVDMPVISTVCSCIDLSLPLEPKTIFAASCFEQYSWSTITRSILLQSRSFFHIELCASIARLEWIQDQSVHLAVSFRPCRIFQLAEVQWLINTLCASSRYRIVSAGDLTAWPFAYSVKVCCPTSTVRQRRCAYSRWQGGIRSLNRSRSRRWDAGSHWRRFWTTQRHPRLLFAQSGRHAKFLVADSPVAPYGCQWACRRH